MRHLLVGIAGLVAGCATIPETALIADEPCSSTAAGLGSILISGEKIPRQELDARLVVAFGDVHLDLCGGAHRMRFDVGPDVERLTVTGAAHLGSETSLSALADQDLFSLASDETDLVLQHLDLTSDRILPDRLRTGALELEGVRLIGDARLRYLGPSAVLTDVDVIGPARASFSAMTQEASRFSLQGEDAYVMFDSALRHTAEIEDLELVGCTRCEVEVTGALDLRQATMRDNDYSQVWARKGATVRGGVFEGNRSTPLHVGGWMEVRAARFGDGELENEGGDVRFGTRSYDWDGLVDQDCDRQGCG